MAGHQNNDSNSNPEFDYVDILRNRGFSGLGISLPEDPIMSANQTMVKKPIMSKNPITTVENPAAENNERHQTLPAADPFTIPSSLPRFGRTQIREYYEIADYSEHPSYWQPMEFCGRIQARGKKMILAAFLSSKCYTPTQIAHAFTNHHYAHLTFITGAPFKCSHNDILKAVAYLVMVGYEWHVRYNTYNKGSWEGSEEAWKEINHWIKGLEKGIPKTERVKGS